jgi:hydroxypyruvate isomerase
MNRRQFAQNALGAAVGLGAMGMMPAWAQSPGAPFKFSVMLWTLNKLGPFDQTIEIVSKAGYTGIELVGEWRKWSDDDVTKVVARLKGLGLRVDSMAGVKGSFSDPDTIDALLADLGVSFVMAKKLGCTQIILTTGKRVAKSTYDVCVENLKKIAVIAEKADIEVVIEPIDLLENSTSFLTSVTEGFQMARAVGSPKIKVLYDVYHEQRQAGNLLEKFEKNMDLVSLVHIADVPGRHEPGTGEINYAAIYKLLGKMKYSGFVCMEFYPTGDAVGQLRAAREEAIREARG